MFHLNRLVVYSLPTAMSSLTGNHAMDLLYLLKRTLRSSYLTHQLLEGASRNCLIYQVDRYHKDEDSEEYARTYYEALNPKSIGVRLPIHFMVWKLMVPSNKQHA